MQLVNLNTIPHPMRTAVVTIGNFDGVHLGHQQLLAALVKKAHVLHLPSIAILFEPQPREFFAPDQTIPRLTSLREKLNLIKNSGVDAVLCLKFNAELAQLTAEQFINYIHQQLNVKYICVGDDFQFGKERNGNFTLLQQMGKELGFESHQLPTIEMHGARISSTRIRQLLQTGEFAHAIQLLGHPYQMIGRVQHGDQRGRQLGFPTANLSRGRLGLPFTGVYAVNVEINHQEYQGVTNVGVRPTVGGLKPLVETHIFNFAETIYGQLIKLTFLVRLRDEKKFNSFDELTRQIATDVENAKTFFAAKK